MSEITHEKLIHTLTFHGFRRVTIAELIGQYPEFKDTYVDILHAFEAFEMLELLENRTEYIDAMYSAYTQNDELPIVFINAETYQYDTYQPISVSSGIDIRSFTD